MLSSSPWTRFSGGGPGCLDFLAPLEYLSVQRLDEENLLLEDVSGSSSEGVLSLDTLLLVGRCEENVFGLVESLRRPDVTILFMWEGTRFKVGKAPSFNSLRLGSK